MAEILSALAAAIVQWWMWLAVPVAAVLLWIRLSRGRGVVAHDVVLRVLVAGQFVLLATSLWLTLSETSARPASPTVRRAPQFDSASARSPESLPGRIEPALAPTSASRREAPSASYSPLLTRARILVRWPWWASGVLLAIYAAGLLVSLGSVARAALRLASVRRAARPIADSMLARELARAAAQVGSRAHIACFACDSAPGLALVGWRRKAILIAPALLQRLSATQMRALLAHELCHGTRRDIAWQLGARVLAAATWPLPLNRWVLARMRFVAEVMCDRAALAGVDEPETYASLLADVASAQTARPAAFAVHAGAGSLLRRRIEMIMDRSLRSPGKRNGARLGSIGTAIVLAAPIACVAVKPAAPPLPPIVASDQGAADSGAEAVPSPEVQAAQKQLAEAWVEQARMQYRAGEYDKAKASLREAFAGPALHNQAIPLGEGVAALCVRGGVNGVPQGWPFMHDRRPFLVSCIESRYGGLERVQAGRWVDDVHGVLVQDRALVERVCAAMMPPGREDVRICVEARLYGLDATTAQAWGARFAPPGAREVSRVLSPADTEELVAATASGKGPIRQLSAPCVTALDRQLSFVSVVTQHAYVEKYHLAARGSATIVDPVVSVCDEGVFVEVLPTFEPNGAITLALRSTVIQLKKMKEASLDLPGAETLPIEVPELEAERLTRVVCMQEGQEALLGDIPADGDMARRVMWIRVLARKVPADELRN